MSENSCRNKERKREGHGMDTFLREGNQDQDMGTEGREGRYPSYTETQPRSLLDASFPKPLPIPAPVPDACPASSLNFPWRGGG